MEYHWDMESIMESTICIPNKFIYWSPNSQRDNDLGGY